jgi:hypothetical protein
MGVERVTTEYRTLRLPEDLCKEAETWMTGRFPDVETLLSFLLQEIVKEEAGKLDRAEEDMVQQRLKDLGYI